MSRHPPIGPTPLLLRRGAVDGLYDMLEATIDCLERCGAQYTLIAGSLLGAVRSNSILYCDDDVDIAVVDFELCDGSREIERVAALLATMLCAPEPTAVKSGGDGRNNNDGGIGARGMKKASRYFYQRRPWPACDRVRGRYWRVLFLTFICVLCTLRRQILLLIYNSTHDSARR
jgi:hypothetical protein